MNAVYLSIRQAEEELGSFSRRENVQRWFRELQYYGFIVMVTPGYLGVEGRGKAPHYRLTKNFILAKEQPETLSVGTAPSFTSKEARNTTFAKNATSKFRIPSRLPVTVCAVCR